jgi:hypothetical protein
MILKAFGKFDRQKNGSWSCYVLKFRTYWVSGTVLEIGKKDYQGFLTRPASWKRIMEKFNNPDAPLADKRLGDEMNTMVEGLARYQ